MNEPKPQQVEALDQYVEALLAGRQPPPIRQLHGEDAAALRMAAFLSSTEARQSRPTQPFVAGLRACLFERARRGFWLDWRLSRRGVVQGLAGGVAAVAVCLFGQQALQRVVPGDEPPAGWVPVAKAAELPPGTVKRFIAHDVEGHIMNIGGKIWALSAICTHMACVLQWEGPQQRFLCPCHGAEFDSSGAQIQKSEYAPVLPVLPRIPVQQLNGTLYVVLTG